MATTMTYGNYSFSPVPMVNITKQYLKTGDGTKLGTLFAMGLTGTLTPLPGAVGGISNTVPLVDTLREALTTEGCPFVIKCDDTVLWSGNPRIGDIQFSESNNNWVETIPYTLSLEFDVEGSGEDPSLSPPYIQSATEEWNLEFAQDTSKFSWTLPTTGADSNPYLLNITHSISANGVRHYTDCDTVTKEPWQYAKDYVISKLSTGTDSAFNVQLAATGVINMDVGTFGQYNHMRVQNTDVAGGNYSVNESWIVMDTGTGIPGHSIEDFTVSVEQGITTDLTNVTVEGSIQGVETIDYGSASGEYNITETKYAAASDYWDVIQDRIPNRATLIHTDAVSAKTTIRSLNTQTVSTRVGHNPTKGAITYSYVYDDRPSNCITGALSEIITVNDVNPVDIFASITVLGRAAGPVLQDINTQTSATRDVTIELIVPPVEGCTALILGHPQNNVEEDVAALLCLFEERFTTAGYTQVFKHVDTESWNPKQGTYSRQVGWTYQACTMPGTSLC